MSSLLHDAGLDHLEPDTEAVETPAADQEDSALGSDISTRSGFLTSSIIGYTYENGRRYHAYREGAYYLPNDEAEQSRLDLLHHIFCLAIDGELYLAPLSATIKRCLDFGTGTGIWAMDFADQFPEAQVIGTDLSPIQPHWTPPNLHFYVDDVEDEWDCRPNERFDFIHGRGMGGAIKDWNKLVQDIFDSLKPDGWCEMQEYEAHVFSHDDHSLSKCPNLRNWVNHLNEGFQKLGKDLDIAPKQKKLMRDTGFVDVERRVVLVPLGTWAKGKKAKEMGSFQRQHFDDCIESFTVAIFTRLLGWTLEECQVLMAQCKNEVRAPGNRLYTKFYFTYGRKP